MINAQILIRSVTWIRALAPLLLTILVNNLGQDVKDADFPSLHFRNTPMIQLFISVPSQSSLKAVAKNF